jgi:hypothetical protein
LELPEEADQDFVFPTAADGYANSAQWEAGPVLTIADKDVVLGGVGG